MNGYRAAPLPELMSSQSSHPRTRSYTTGYGSVLVVERVESVKQALEQALLKEGLQTLWARSLAEAEMGLTARRAGLVVLNSNLPPEDGWFVYRRLLRFGIPIMVIAAASSPAVQRVALALGAVECLHPESPATEIAKRIRQTLGHVPTTLPGTLEYAGIRLDQSAGVARIGNMTTPLTRSECALLGSLLEAQGRVVSRDQLVQRARADAGSLPLTRSIDAHVRALRKKLGDDPQQPKLIESVRGFGYRLTAPEGLPVEGLAQAAFAALPEAALVVDAHKEVKLMNESAKAMLGAHDLAGCTCADLLDCQETLGDQICPLQAALDHGQGASVRRAIGSNSLHQLVEEIAVPLPGTHSFLLQLRRCNDD